MELYTTRRGGKCACAQVPFFRTIARAGFHVGWLLFCSSVVFAQSVTISPSAVNFGNQVVDTSGNPKTATLTNTGTTPLTFASIFASGDFSQTNTCGSSILPGKKCAIKITFTPAALAARAGTVTISDNASDTPQTISLTGNGVPPVSLSRSTLTFENAIVGSASAAKSVTLTNNQTTALNISSIAASGDFAQSNTCGTTLSGKAHCTIGVTFTPTAAGTRAGAITITDNASSSPQTIALTGTGVAVVLVKLTVTPTPVTLGTLQTQQFAATGTYNNRTTQDLTNVVTWTVKQAIRGGSVTSSGLYTAPTLPGAFTVLATNANPLKKATAKVTVVAHQPPVANPGGPYSGNANQSLIFDGSKSSDPNGLPLTYSWNFGDGNTGTGISPTHTYIVFGTYTVALTVSDTLGGTNTATTTASVNAFPTANPGGPYSSNVGQSITFDGSKSNDPDGDPLTYSWTFGDQGIGTGANPTHTYNGTGIYTVSLTVNDGRGGSNTATTQATITTSGTTPIVKITSPIALALLNATPVAVAGTVDNPSDTVVVNGVTASVSNGTFTAQSIPLSEGPNLLTATATNQTGNVGTASISVTLDTTPPHVSIDTPANGSVATSSTVTVSGMISDVVLGTVNAQQATVTVNGIAAQVSNRSYLVNAVPLSPGANTVTAIGIDAAGNTASTSITVVFSPPTGQPTINLVSGNNQTTVIGSQLSVPLVVALKDASGNAVQGQMVVFRITANNGTLSAPGAVASPDGRSVAVTTGANGQAQATWTLGMRAGAGNNMVKATAANFTGEVDFTAIALQGTPGMISLDAGNNQTGVIGQALPRPFVIAVTDAGHNRLPNIPVTFTVKQGGGTINGPVTMHTDSDGHASAILLLGEQEGITNNLVEANFAGSNGFPVTFTASGMAAGNPANTQISGVVLDDTNIPIAGVTLSVEGTTLTTQSDLQGQFVLTGVPVGTVKLQADGSTAARPGSWPTMAYEMVTIAGQNNTIGMPIYLLPLNLAEGLQVDATHGGTITLAEVPGFSLTIAPGSVTFPDGTNSGIVSVTLVHADKVPMTPNFGQQPRFIVSIQPAGSHFNPPAPMTIPNVDGLKPGEVTEMYSFDHDLGSFVAIGTGTVSADGTVIKSDPGVGIIKGGWHCGGNPTTGGTASNCGTCQTCNGNACISSSAGTSCSATNACITGGTCDGNGNCVGGAPVNCGPPGDICTGTNFCDPVLGCQTTPPLQCDDNNVCNGVESCDPTLGCVPGAALRCDDHNVCNGVEACDPANGCQSGPPLQCDNGNVCDGLESCDPLNGCQPGTPLKCDDGNACNGTETCDSTTGCQPGTSLPLGSSCGACIAGGSCDGNGSCVGGVPVSCDDGNPCNGLETCDSSTGCAAGSPPPDGTPCANGGTCQQGSCSDQCVYTILDDGPVQDQNSGFYTDLAYIGLDVPWQFSLSASDPSCVTGTDQITWVADPNIVQIGPSHASRKAPQSAMVVQLQGIALGGTTPLQVLKNNQLLKTALETLDVVPGGIVLIRASLTSSDKHGAIAGGDVETPPDDYTVGGIPFTGFFAATPTVVNGGLTTIGQATGQVGQEVVIRDASWNEVYPSYARKGVATADCKATIPPRSDGVGYCDLSPPYDLGSDVTPPLITQTVAPPPNNNGWNNTDVSATFVCDDQGGVGVATCPTDFTVSADGANQKFYERASDNVGNASYTKILLNIDKTPPVIDFTSQSPLPNPAGWNNTVPVSWSFTTTETLSGIDPARTTSSPVQFSSEGRGLSQSVNASDMAGNSAAVVSPFVNIDITPPVFSNISPASGSTVTASTVQVTGTINDNLSGVDSNSISCPLALVTVSGSLSGSTFTCQPLTLQFGPNTILIGANDVAGNSALSSIVVNYSTSRR